MAIPKPPPPPSRGAAQTAQTAQASPPAAPARRPGPKPVGTAPPQREPEPEYENPPALGEPEDANWDEDENQIEEQAEVSVPQETEPTTMAVSRPNPPASAPAPNRSTEIAAQSNLIKQAREMGFDIDEADLSEFGVFPVIALHKEGVFRTSDKTLNLGEEFYAKRVSEKKKILYKTKKQEGSREAEELVYTFDDVYATGSGKPIKEILEEWKEKGYKHDRKEYRDVRLVIVDEQGNDSALVILSVPPTSKSHYTNLILQLMRWKAMFNRDVSEALIRVYKGPTVTSGNWPFDPIQFEIVR